MFLRWIRLTWLLAIPIALGCSRGGSGLPEGGAIHAEELPDASRADPTAGPAPGGAGEITSLCPVVVAHLASIENITPKRGERQMDSHAKLIVSLGKAAGPCLVEKITDMTPSLCFYLYPYTVGELALYLLDEIYLPTSWPFPSQHFENGYAYHEFLASAGVRARLQEQWRSYVAAHREPTE